MERKVILVLPVSDEGLLQNFVKECLSENVDLIAIFGPEASRFDDEIDWLMIDLEVDPSRSPVTTAHSDETWDEVLEFVASWTTEPSSGVSLIYL